MKQAVLLTGLVTAALALPVDNLNYRHDGVVRGPQGVTARNEDLESRGSQAEVLPIEDLISIAAIAARQDGGEQGDATAIEYGRRAGGTGNSPRAVIKARQDGGEQGDATAIEYGRRADGTGNHPKAVIKDRQDGGEQGDATAIEYGLIAALHAESRRGTDGVGSPARAMPSRDNGVIHMEDNTDPAEDF